MYLSLSLRKTFGVFVFPLPSLVPERGLEDKVIYFILSFLSSFSPLCPFAAISPSPRTHNTLFLSFNFTCELKAVGGLPV